MKIRDEKETATTKFTVYDYKFKKNRTYSCGCHRHVTDINVYQCCFITRNVNTFQPKFQQVLPGSS